MRFGPKTLWRLAPPALALAALCGACAYGVWQIEARMQGYGGKAVVINELCAHNLSGLQDGDGACGDWIELYNPGGEPVDLTGWSLSDDKDDPAKWTFPAGTEVQDYLVVFADGTARQDAAGYWHTSFALNTGGETLYLYDAAGELVDKLKYPEQDFDITYGRAFGSGAETGTFATATPGAANPVDFLRANDEAPLGTAEFSLPAGFYEGEIEVALQADDPEALIFYTTDGSDPAEYGQLYTGPVHIYDRTGEANEYASMPNRLGYGYTIFLKNYAVRYAPDPVDKATTLTVRLYKDGCWSDETAATTYWVNVEPHTLPVVSVTADPEELFGMSGIYAPGYTYYTLTRMGRESRNANFLSEERIDANVQILGLGDDGSLETQIAVAGQNSRVWFQLKNLSVNLPQQNETLGRLLREQDLDGFSLKAPGNGHWQGFYVDGFWNNYLYDKDLGAQYNIPVILYLEDEYWGIYCIRNRKDESFIAQQFGVDEDSVTICTSTEPDADNSIQTLDQILREMTCDEAGWAWLNATFDIDSFIDYLIPDLYNNNWDGVRTASNTIIWKATEGDAENADGRWRFLLNDYDMSLMYGFWDPFQDLLTMEPDANNMQLVLFQKLWQYEEFRTRFAEKLRAELATTYAPENILPAFEAWQEQLAPEMERNIVRQRVEATPLLPLADFLTRTESDVQSLTMEQWQADLEEIRTFLTDRAGDLEEFLDGIMAQAK